MYVNDNINNKLSKLSISIFKNFYNKVSGRCLCTFIFIYKNNINLHFKNNIKLNFKIILIHIFKII